MKLVLAEKPSVAQSIAKVLGAAKREDGYACLFTWSAINLVAAIPITSFPKRKSHRSVTFL